ncbi:hypothetical protein B0O99DRAFT_688780 [Bisporella sp. PMI_857]|nr:hypothetical protein B0O99DRAFT_688780 [Bisporella sp. PMI_857]
MKPFCALLALCAIALAISSDLIDETAVYIQSLDASSSPSRLAEIKFNPSTLDAELSSYDAPILSPGSKRVRIGVYDPVTGSWKSSTSVTSAESFAKGFQPTIVLSLDAQGEVLGASLKASIIDAGQTRNFGPRVRVRKTQKGKQPSLNRPVVLSPEGKVAEPEPEKTILQKYWWVILLGIMLLMTAGPAE